VNARLPFILVDVWYRSLPGNTAVLTFGTNIASLLMTADRLRLTTINEGKTRPYPIYAQTKSYSFCMCVLKSRLNLPLQRSKNCRKVQRV